MTRKEDFQICPFRQYCSLFVRGILGGKKKLQKKRTEIKKDAGSTIGKKGLSEGKNALINKR